MQAIETVKRAINSAKLILTSQKDWRKPERKKILIYDARTGQPLLNYIDVSHASLLYQVRERPNLYVLLRCVLLLKLSWRGYIKQYIDAVEPEVVITSTDNSIVFYELKAIYPHITTISVQVSWRGEQTDVFHYLKTQPGIKKLHVDYMLTYNSEVGEMYRRYIDAQVIAIGSLINNHFGQATVIEAKTLVFISEFRLPKPGAIPDLRLKSGEQATWADVYSLERIALPFLADYCHAKGMTLKICGAKNRDQAAERDFYSEILGDRDWQWVPRSDWFSNYKVVTGAEVVVFINSTLGYESLARGKKVACLSARGNWYQNSSSWKFGWPSDLPDAGPFWTNHADKTEFKRVLDYVTSVGEAEWKQTWGQFGPRIMVFDPGNAQFVSLMRKLGVPIKVDDQTVPMLRAIRT